MQTYTCKLAIDIPVVEMHRWWIVNRQLLACVVAFLLSLAADVHAVEIESSSLRGGIHRDEIPASHPGADPDSAQSDADSVDNEAATSSRNDFETFLFDFTHALSSPARWDSHDLMLLGGVAAGTITAVLLDDECRELMQRNQSPFNDALDEVGYTYGAPQFAAPLSILMYLTGLIANNDWTRETGLMLISTLSTAAVIQIPSRMIAGRARPNANLGNASFDLFGGTAQHRASFISGHAFIAF